MKLFLFSLFSLYFFFFERGEGKKENYVTLNTYYNYGKIIPYITSQKCKNHYDKYYRDCFNYIDNDNYNITNINVDWPVVCKVYNDDACKAFIDNLFLSDDICKDGNGTDDFDIYDYVRTNKNVYLVYCSTDKNGEICPYTKSIFDETYSILQLFRLTMNDTDTLLKSFCSNGICRESLHFIYDTLVTLYTHDIEINSTRFAHEQEYLDNSLKAIELLGSEECVSQDYYEIDKPDLYQSGVMKTSFSLITIVLISILSIIFY
ncbi:hypothetical protein BCR36DRAFT_583834 [Piromyces finnis]|uniref:Uncharacterized protein n=1 Tax=Piromyces finnis TaxID=1754191 RepID=A0A1Y1V7I5_9FUNG|nr:hypothetical protein BCR36DRAFT_583834 [Piromyces finnis]|eukprot:ORX49227.1 hypothetical protein BCR36DRAFT_583834 [Piromyces finnis]